MRLALVALLALGACAEPSVEVVVRSRDTVRQPARFQLELLEAGSGKRAVLARDVRGLTLPLSYELLLGDREGEQVLSLVAFDREGARVGQGSVAFDLDVLDVELLIEPDEFGVNTTVAESQRLAMDGAFAGRQLAVAPDGSFLIAWEHHRRGESQARARLFGADTRPRANGVSFSTAEYVLAQYPDEDDHPVVAYGSTGYLAAWESDANGARGIFGRVYDLVDGTSVRLFPESPLSEGTGDAGHPAVFAVGDGYGVAWIDRQALADDGALSVRLVGPTGDPVEPGSTGAISVSSEPGAVQAYPDGVGLSDGGFALVWQQNRDVADRGARLRFFDGAGAPASTELEVDTRQQFEATVAPKVAALPGGGVVVSWIYESMAGRLVRMRRFDVAGRALAEAVTVAALEDRGHAVVAAAADGTVAVVWYDGNGNGQERDVFVRFYRDDQPLGEATVVNTQVPGDQLAAAVAARPGGGFVVSWTDRSGAAPDVDGEGVAARVVYPPE